jgi:hypothetical protein
VLGKSRGGVPQPLGPEYSEENNPRGLICPANTEVDESEGYDPYPLLPEFKSTVGLKLSV